MRVIIPPLAGLLSCIGCINLTYRSLKLDPVVLNEFNDDNELNDPVIDELGVDLDIDDNELGVETDNDPGIDGNEPNDTCEFGVDPLDPG